MDYMKYIGSKTALHSKTLGDIVVESASFTPSIDGDMVVYFGNPLRSIRPLVRIHSQCTFSEVLDVDCCDCASQLQEALKKLKESKAGILFYLRFDGRGVGLASKTKATALQNEGVNTYDAHTMIGVPPEARDFSPIAEFLRGKGITQITLLTNSPQKIKDLVDNGIDVIAEPLFENEPNPKVAFLYETKSKFFNHILPNTHKKD